MFYLSDYKHKTREGEEIVDKDVLHFKFGDFDGHATVKHITEHPKAYQKFLKANPDFKSKFKEVAEEEKVIPSNDTVVLNDKEKAKPGKSKSSFEDSKGSEDQGKEAAKEADPVDKPKRAKKVKSK